MSQKEALIAATQELLAEYGYESTSPKDIQRVSGAGQGSFYHHFGSKKELAIAALEKTADEMLSQESTAKKSGLPELVAFLEQKRNPLNGCKLGRHAAEQSIITDGELKAPLCRYFSGKHKSLVDSALFAKTSGDLPKKGASEDLAWLLLAAVQGGFTLARVQGHSGPMKGALKALIQLLNESKSN